MIIDGKQLALKHESALKQKIASLPKKPFIVSIMVGDDPASVLYSEIKAKKAVKLGIGFELEKFSLGPEKWEVVSSEIKKLNQERGVTGIMVQLPLPEDFLGNHTKEELIELIDPKKDVDGLTEKRSVPPAVVRAILSILEDEEIEIKDKTVAVLGRSALIGTPVAQELIKRGAKVLVGHSQTPDLSEITKEADVIISAVGKSNLVTGEMVKNGVAVIDAGTLTFDGAVKGDIDFDSVSPKASKITPVPGGVGPLTVVSLMENAVELLEKQVMI